MTEPDVRCRFCNAAMLLWQIDMLISTLWSHKDYLDPSSQYVKNFDFPYFSVSDSTPKTLLLLLFSTFVLSFFKNSLLTPDTWAPCLYFHFSDHAEIASVKLRGKELRGVLAKGKTLDQIYIFAYWEQKLEGTDICSKSQNKKSNIFLFTAYFPR